MCQCGVFGIMAQQSCAGCALYAVADGGDEQCADEAKQGAYVGLTGENIDIVNLI